MFSVLPLDRMTEGLFAAYGLGLPETISFDAIVVLGNYLPADVDGAYVATDLDGAHDTYAALGQRRVLVVAGASAGQNVAATADPVVVAGAYTADPADGTYDGTVVRGAHSDQPAGGDHGRQPAEGAQ